MTKDWRSIDEGPDPENDSFLFLYRNDPQHKAETATLENPRRGRGRPSKVLNESVRQRFLLAIKFGASYETACRHAGVSTSAWNNWVQRAEAGRGEYREFVAAVRDAEADLQLQALGIIRAVAQGEVIQRNSSGGVLKKLPANWKAAAWILERRFPADFSQRLEAKIEKTERYEQELVLRILGDDTSRELALQLAERVGLGVAESGGTGSGSDEG